jgi:hypothetical protein
MAEKTVRNKITTRLKWQQISKIKNGAMAAWTDGRMDGRTDGRTDGQTDGQAAKCTFEGTSAIGNRQKHERERVNSRKKE